MGLNDKTIEEYADCASWAESTCSIVRSGSRQPIKA